MKFINDTVLNNLVQKINGIFRIDNHNKIRHDDINTRLFQGEKIILKHDGETRPYLESNGQLSYGGKTAFKIGEVTHSPNKMGFLTIDNNELCLHSEIYNSYYKRIYIDKNYGVYSTMPFHIYGGVYGAEYVQHKTAYLQDHTLSGKELYIKYLNPLPPKLRTGDGTHITDYSYKDTLFFANDVTTVNNIKNKKTSLVFGLEYKKQNKHGYKGITFYNDLDFNSHRLYGINTLYANYITCDNYIDTDMICLSHIKFHSGVGNITELRHNHFSMHLSDNDVRKTVHSIGTTGASFQVRDTSIHSSHASGHIGWTAFTLGVSTSLNTYYSNIWLRAGRSCKIQLISQTPVAKFAEKEDYDNRGERINIYGSIYFPHVEENIPGVTTSNYTTAQLNTLSNTPLQGIILNLMKQNQNLQSQIDTLINQLNNLS